MTGINGIVVLPDDDFDHSTGQHDLVFTIWLTTVQNTIYVKEDVLCVVVSTGFEVTTERVVLLLVANALLI
jgi:hypothetical protein